MTGFVNETVESSFGLEEKMPITGHFPSLTKFYESTFVCVCGGGGGGGFVTKNWKRVSVV